LQPKIKHILETRGQFSPLQEMERVPTEVVSAAPQRIEIFAWRGLASVIGRAFGPDRSRFIHVLVPASIRTLELL
jgi:hypothetical protein